MFGYTTAKQALTLGYTHHGKYFGIPVWLAPNDPEFPVQTKWTPLELAFTAAMWIEQFLACNFFPEREPSFQFWIGDPIEQRQASIVEKMP